MGENHVFCRLRRFPTQKLVCLQRVKATKRAVPLIVSMPTFPLHREYGPEMKRKLCEVSSRNRTTSCIWRAEPSVRSTVLVVQCDRFTGCLRLCIPTTAHARLPLVMLSSQHSPRNRALDLLNLH